MVKNTIKPERKSPTPPEYGRIKILEVPFQGEIFKCGYNKALEMVTINGNLVDCILIDQKVLDAIWEKMDEILKDDDYSAELREEENRGN